MENKIISLKTIGVKTEKGIAHAIMIGVEVLDVLKVDQLVQNVIEKFKNQKMASPPDTSLMLITITGDLTAKDFKKSWDIYIKKDSVMKVFMSQIKKADVIHGTKEGKPLDSISLI